MRIDVISLFPGLVAGVVGESILKRACDAGLVKILLHDLRKFAVGKHNQADDYLFGGGAGMLLKPEPFFRAMGQFDGVRPRPLVICPSAAGEVFDQESAAGLARERHLVFLCGHYKGLDQRAIDRLVDREYSLGNYVVTGGELAAAVMIDATVRLMPGVLGDFDSARGDSFQGLRLDAPHYTRPAECEGLTVPAVLQEGHHRNVGHWREAMGKLILSQRRPDLKSIKPLEE
ncbi:MAG: tRNA (guanosine(37)-N1)-methyltransferase TrmD [Calditrichaeota bacterium]|nr:tRNA (guanosine(37)-N1)-methyltransferase TrmD [Calditrichota bacterium]